MLVAVEPFDSVELPICWPATNVVCRWRFCTAFISMLRQIALNMGFDPDTVGLKKVTQNPGL